MAVSRQNALVGPSTCSVTPICPLCNEPVELDTTKTNGDGEAFQPGVAWVFQNRSNSSGGVKLPAFGKKLTEQLGQDQTGKIRHEQNRHSGVALSPCVKLFVHWFVKLQRATLSFFGTSSVQLSERKSGARRDPRQSSLRGRQL